MELQIPTSAVAEHRGSYSSVRSAKSTLAGGMWTPPHSPTTENMETEPYEDDEEIVQNSETTPMMPEKHMQTTVDHSAESQTQTSAANDGHPPPGAQATPQDEQPAELRLSDFQV
ncbi:hypothetical protein FRC17_009885, partial [Serendipita sp. 399]